MTQRPRFNPNIARLPGDVYSAFGDRIHDHPGPLFPMHVGDTWLAPFVGARVEDVHTADHPGLHNYCDTRGQPELVDALVEKVRAKNGLPCERESLLVSAGATSGLACAVTAIVSAGDEVLVLAPFWPLIRGIVQATGGTPVEVPFYDRIHSAGDAVAALEERVSERTVALYVSTPSNPTGVVLPRDWLEAMSEFAARHGLWLLSDEVYEDFVYRGEHFSVGTLAPERTVSFFSFSKAYGMAGNRAQGRHAHLLQCADALSARGTGGAGGRRCMAEAGTRSVSRGGGPRGRRTRPACARRIDVPLRACREQARRARSGWLPRRLLRRRCAGRARRLERRRLQRMDPALLHRDAAGGDRRRHQTPGTAGAGLSGSFRTLC
jgi:hypothetical protein